MTEKTGNHRTQGTQREGKGEILIGETMSQNVRTRGKQEVRINKYVFAITHQITSLTPLPMEEETQPAALLRKT